MIAAVLVSIACGVVGSYVVIKRIVSFSGAISHTAFGGVGLGYFFGVNPVLAAIPFSITSAMAIGGIRADNKYQRRHWHRYIMGCWDGHRCNIINLTWLRS